jgi:methionyl-tRNA formyltransferase
VRAVWVSFDAAGRVCLEATAAAGAEIVGIVTLAGPIEVARSGQVPFDDLARRFDAALLETNDVNSVATVAAVRELEPDLIFVVGWSQLVRREFIALAARGVFGMHPTLLPRHRGRAPIPWTILSGLATTGATLFEIIDPTADSGPIIGQVEVTVDADETATSLYDKQTAAHVTLLREFVPRLLDGTAPRTPQVASRASAWPKRAPADGIIDWNTRARYLYDWVRAQTRPYPGAFTYLGDERIVVWRARAAALEQAASPGTVVARGRDELVVACGEGALVLEEIETAAELAVGAMLG